MTQKSIGIMGMGDGGNNMMCAQIERLRDVSRPDLEHILAIACNTNQESYVKHVDRLKITGVSAVPLPLGPKTTGLQGTGHIYQVGLKAANEGIDSGAFRTFFLSHRVDALITSASFADGATGLASLYPVTKHLRDDLGIFTIPVICYGNVEMSGISPRRQLLLDQILQQFDDSGIPLVLALMDKIDDHLTTEEAFKRMDSIIADGVGCLIQVLLDPRAHDRNDLRVELQSNPGRKKKRLRMAGGTLSLEEVVDKSKLAQATQRIFENRYYDFPDGNIGSVVLGVRHPDLPRVQEMAIRNTLIALIQNKYEAEHPHCASPVELKPDIRTVAGLDRVHISMVLAEYTGEVTDLSELPSFGWVRADTAVLPWSTVGSKDFGMQTAEAKENPSLPPEPSQRPEPALNFSAPVKDADFEPPVVDEREAASPATSPQPDPVHQHKILTAKDIASLPHRRRKKQLRRRAGQAAFEERSINSVSSQAGPTETDRDKTITATAPECGPSESIQTDAPPPIPAQVPQKPANTTIYRSFSALTDAAGKRADAVAIEILEQGDPYQETLPDGRLTNEVLLFTREGEAWSDQVVLTLFSLTILVNSRRKKVGSANVLSEPWERLVKEGLQSKGKWLPRIAHGYKLDYSKPVVEVTNFPSYRGLKQKVQDAIQAGSRIYSLCGVEFVENLLVEEENGNRGLVGALSRFRAVINS